MSSEMNVVVVAETEPVVVVETTEKIKKVKKPVLKAKHQFVYQVLFKVLDSMTVVDESNPDACVLTKAQMRSILDSVDFYGDDVEAQMDLMDLNFFFKNRDSADQKELPQEEKDEQKKGLKELRKEMRDEKKQYNKDMGKVEPPKVKVVDPNAPVKVKKPRAPKVVDPNAPAKAPGARGRPKKSTEPVVVEPSVEPVIEPVVEPVIEPVVSPIIAPVIEPVVAPIIAPVIEPVVAPIIAPIIEPAVKPKKTVKPKPKKTVDKEDVPK